MTADSRALLEGLSGMLTFPREGFEAGFDWASVRQPDSALLDDIEAQLVVVTDAEEQMHRQARVVDKGDDDAKARGVREADDKDGVVSNGEDRSSTVVQVAEVAAPVVAVAHAAAPLPVVAAVAASPAHDETEKEGQRPNTDASEQPKAADAKEKTGGGAPQMRTKARTAANQRELADLVASFIADVGGSANASAIATMLTKCGISLKPQFKKVSVLIEYGTEVGLWTASGPSHSRVATLVQQQKTRSGARDHAFREQAQREAEEEERKREQEERTRREEAQRRNEERETAERREQEKRDEEELQAKRQSQKEKRDEEEEKLAEQLRQTVVVQEEEESVKSAVAAELASVEEIVSVASENVDSERLAKSDEANDSAPIAESLSPPRQPDEQGRAELATSFEGGKQSSEEEATSGTMSEQEYAKEFKDRIGSVVQIALAGDGKWEPAKLMFLGGLADRNDGAVYAGLVLSYAGGRNDGSVNGTRYFQCDQKCGVFVRCNPRRLRVTPKLTHIPAPDQSAHIERLRLARSKAK